MSDSDRDGVIVLSGVLAASLAIGLGLAVDALSIGLGEAACFLSWPVLAFGVFRVLFASVSP
jgi:hypothetical protein